MENGSEPSVDKPEASDIPHARNKPLISNPDPQAEISVTNVSTDGPALAGNAEDSAQQVQNPEDSTQQAETSGSFATEVQVPGSQTRLHQARQDLIKNETSGILSQVRAIERRLTNMNNMLMEQDQDLRSREARATEREGWLRHREHSVLMRERNARRREQEITDREEGLSRVAKNIPRSTLARFTPRFSGTSIGSQTPASDRGSTGRFSWNRPSSPIDSSPGSPSLRERFLKDGLKHRGTGLDEDTGGAGSAVHAQSETVSARVSLQGRGSTDATQAGPRESRFREEVRTAPSSAANPTEITSPPTTPPRRSHPSLRRMLFPLIPRTPPPPYSSPFTSGSTGYSAPGYSAGSLWSRTRAATGNIAGHVMPKANSEEQSRGRVQRHIERLEREAREAEARLEQARKEERDKAVSRARGGGVR